MAKSTKLVQSQASLRAINRSKILKLLYKEGSMPRNQISKLVGLTAPSVTRIINECISANLIVEQEHEGMSKKAGRKPIPISLNSSEYYVVGIHLGKLWIDIGLLNLNGKVIAYIRQNRPHQVDEALNFIKDTVQQFGKHHDGQVLTIGLTLYGQVDTANGVILKKNALGWKDVPIRSWLEDNLNIRTIIDTNVYSMAFTEYQFNPLPSDEALLFVSIGTTIGLGLSINEVVIRGKQGVAGMIEHLASIDGGPAGVHISALLTDPELLKQARKISPELGLDDIHDLIKHSKHHPKLHDIMMERAERAGKFIARLAIIHDPGRIVLSGSILLDEHEQMKVVKDAYQLSIETTGGDYADLELPSNKEKVPFPLIGAGTIAIFRALSTDLEFKGGIDDVEGMQTIAHIPL